MAERICSYQNADGVCPKAVTTAKGLIDIVATKLPFAVRFKPNDNAKLVKLEEGVIKFSQGRICIEPDCRRTIYFSPDRAIIPSK